MRKTRLRPKAKTAQPVSPDELKAWRKFMRYTQKDAADYLGVTVRSIENWEQGERPMRHPGTMRKLMQQADIKWRWPQKTKAPA